MTPKGQHKRKNQTLEISLCTRRTQRSKGEDSELGERRSQQIHSSHKQRLLNWSPDDNASLMDHVRIGSFGEMSISKVFWFCILEKEVKMTMNSSERMAWERGTQVSAENAIPST